MRQVMDNRTAIVLLTLVQLSLWLVVRPQGNFPLNDDWAYAHSVEWLLQEGRIRLSEWIAPNILPQILMGSAASRLSGFSFEVLRHVTQVTALLTSFTAFIWFRSARLPAGSALVATLVVLAMPSWPVLANSFMSDLYGLLFGLLAAVAFWRSLERPSAGALAGATAVICLGVLQRQVLLVIPFAYMVAMLWQHRSWKLSRIMPAALPLAAAVLALQAYRFYLETGPGIPRAQAYGTGRFLPLLMDTVLGQNNMRQFVFFNLATMIGYLGLFLAPWAAWWGGGRSINRAWVLVATALLAGLMLKEGWLPPFLGNNTIDAAGIGPFTLYDAMPRGLADLQRSPGPLWQAAAIVSAAGAIGFLAGMFIAGRRLLRLRAREDAEVVFLVTLVAAYMVPFLLTGYFDRYLLFLLPFLITLWARLWPASPGKGLRGLRSAAIAWIAMVLVIASLGTHDYFSWNRARWAAIAHAERLGGTPASIDGGFEYNAYYRFEQAAGRRMPGKSWWWVADDDYVVTFTEVPGYQVIQAFPVIRYIDRTPAQVLLSRRNTGGPPD